MKELVNCSLALMEAIPVKLRNLFQTFRHPEHESCCHELTDQQREEALRRVDELLSKSLNLASQKNQTAQKKTNTLDSN
jgi:hypothetical protein